MSTPTSPPVNGRARKSLEHQLDRLDAILDGLADALDGAVADAVREGVGRAVKEAVQVVVAELLTNPDVAKKLAEAHGLTRPPAAPPEPPAPAGPTWRERLAARLRRVRAAAAAAKDRAVAAVAGRLNTARTILTCAVRLARADRRGVTFAAAAGVVVGVGCHLCGPVVAATVSGIASTALALCGWVLRPLYPVLPLLASARAADRLSVRIPRSPFPLPSPFSR